MPRFFVDKRKILGDTIYIDGDNVNHIKNVFRMKVGDELVLCDGCGNDYRAVIMTESFDCITADIVNTVCSSTEPCVKVTLYQGLPKGSKMDLIIQKNVELGVSRIVPVICRRTIVKLDKKDIKRKVDRWNKIAYEAAKQSGRGIVPCVAEPLAFVDAVDIAKTNNLLLIPYEIEKETRLKDVLKKNMMACDVGVFVGPEGGFDEQEIDIATCRGAIPVTLGDRILRTETASMYMTSIIVYELDQT